MRRVIQMSPANVIVISLDAFPESYQRNICWPRFNKRPDRHNRSTAGMECETKIMAVPLLFNANTFSRHFC